MKLTSIGFLAPGPVPIALTFSISRFNSIPLPPGIDINISLRESTERSPGAFRAWSKALLKSETEASEM